MRAERDSAASENFFFDAEVSHQKQLKDFTVRRINAQYDKNDDGDDDEEEKYYSVDRGA